MDKYTYMLFLSALKLCGHEVHVLYSAISMEHCLFWCDLVNPFLPTVPTFVVRKGTANV